MKEHLNISVRSLVEFTLSSGDLELTFFGTSNPVEAIRAHQRIQKLRPDAYKPEYTVSHSIETDDFKLTIRGRIDGVFEYPEMPVIEEIKTSRRKLQDFKDTENILHWAQAKCYAFIYAEENDLTEIGVLLTYYHLETGETLEIPRQYTMDELREFFNSLVDSYLTWASNIAEWNRTRDESILNLNFPFHAYRAGQREMAVEVYHAVKCKDQAILQAPTGIGKTLAALFPAIKAFPERLTEKVFYLTARTTGKSVAESTMAVMISKGLRFKSLTLTAKDKTCFNPEKACTGAECKYARGHFDRVRDALSDAFTRDTFDRETIEGIAKDHTVCPFEFSLDLSLWVDCVICDYNYAFDPRVYLRRFFDEENGEYTFLIDEAHNLPDRARDMFSAELEKQSILDLRKSIKDKLPGLYKNLGAINTKLLEIMKRCTEKGGAMAEKEEPSKLNTALRRFLSGAEKWLSLNIQTTYRDELLDIYFTVNNFLKVTERFDESYAVCSEILNKKNMRLKLFCIDPSKQLKEGIERAHTSVFFSATMIPTHYFRRIFGCDDAYREMILPSPFPAENLCLLSAVTISTLYRNREKTKHEIKDMIEQAVQSKKGNYLVFFPSYQYMTMVHELFENSMDNVEIIIQTRGMTEKERGEFLERFECDSARTLVGFAVMGGVFGEGIDLLGERLTGAIIVGVGLPGISLERDLIKDYFSSHNGNGFDFAYRFPGINKVFQAAGRVIRSEEDRGVVLLIDERFGSTPYSVLFPPDWRPTAIESPEMLQKELNTFWDSI